jgi:cytochrome c
MKHEIFLALAIGALAIGSAQAQDTAAGQTVFKKCQACHDIGEGAKSRMGPVLTGVVGRVAGTYEGYKYSKAMVDAGAGGLTWTPETLDAFLTSPRDYVPGTKMSGISLKDATERANVIAYLQTLSAPAGTPPAQ